VTDDDLLGAVREAWAETLGIDPKDVPLEEGFFDVGGNSLLLVLLSEHLDELTSDSVRAADLFRHPTVRSQVRLLGGNA
jgi:Phosphopantetheine attachment site